jgi:hypothetical protein
MADAMRLTNATASIIHDYYPPTIHLPHYVANEGSVASLIARFGVLWTAVLGGAFATLYHVRPTASRSDQVAFVWMCFSLFLSARAKYQISISWRMITQRDLSISFSKHILSLINKNTCGLSRIIRPVVERVFSFWLALLDIWCFRSLYGGHNCSTSVV